jgi:hypothetical protein
MTFRIVQAKYDHVSERAYVELEANDDDGGEMRAVAIFFFRTKSKLTRRQFEQEVVRKARHVLKRAGAAI